MAMWFRTYSITFFQVHISMTAIHCRTHLCKGRLFWIVTLRIRNSVVGSRWQMQLGASIPIAQYGYCSNLLNALGRWPCLQTGANRCSVRYEQIDGGTKFDSASKTYGSSQQSDLITHYCGTRSDAYYHTFGMSICCIHKPESCMWRCLCSISLHKPLTMAS